MAAVSVKRSIDSDVELFMNLIQCIRFGLSKRLATEPGLRVSDGWKSYDHTIKNLSSCFAMIGRADIEEKAIIITKVLTKVY